MDMESVLEKLTVLRLILSWVTVVLSIACLVLTVKSRQEN